MVEQSCKTLGHGGRAVGSAEGGARAAGRRLAGGPDDGHAPGQDHTLQQVPHQDHIRDLHSLSVSLLAFIVPTSVDPLTNHAGGNTWSLMLHSTCVLGSPLPPAPFFAPAFLNTKTPIYQLELKAMAKLYSCQISTTYTRTVNGVVICQVKREYNVQLVP